MKLVSVDYEPTPFDEDEEDESYSLTPVDYEPEPIDEADDDMVPRGTMEPEHEEAGFFDRAGDVGVDVLKGAVASGQTVVGLGGMVSGGLISDGMRALGYDPQKTTDILSSLYSEERQAEEKKFEEAEGFMESAGAILTQPAVLAGKVVESGAMMLNSMAAARHFSKKAAEAAFKEAVKKGANEKVARKVSEAAAAKAGTISASASEGIQQAGGSFDDYMAQGTDLGTAYTASIGSGITTATIGYFAGKTGLGDVEAGIKSATGGRLAGMGKGAIQEGFLEELPQSASEQMWNNFANDRDLMEGVPKAAGTGMVVGSAAGAGFSLGKSAVSETIDELAEHSADPIFDKSGTPLEGDAVSQAITDISGVEFGAMPEPEGTIGGAADYSQRGMLTQDTGQVTSILEGQKPTQMGGIDMEGERPPLTTDLGAQPYKPIEHEVAGLPPTEMIEKVEPGTVEFTLPEEEKAELTTTPGAAPEKPEAIDFTMEAAGEDITAETKPAAERRIQREEKIAEQAEERGEVKEPEGLPDKRLNRLNFRQSLKKMSGDLVEKGGVTVTTMPGTGYINSEGVEMGADTARSQSVNPDWFKVLGTEEDSIGMKKVQSAVDKALKGETLGVKEARIVSSMMDNIQGEREMQVDHAKEQLEAQRADMKAMKQDLPPVAAYAEYVDNAGDVLDESEYGDSWDAESRSMYELASYAEDINPTEADTIVAGWADQTITKEEAQSQFLKMIGESDGQAEARGIAEVEGKPEAEAQAAQAEEVEVAASEAATSPDNALPEPTEAQKEAGNYKMGKVSLHGLDISIENPKGSIRSGTDEKGGKWESKMAHHYGYIKGTKGADGDHVDAFLTENAGDATLPVHVIDQINPETGAFDEHKTIIGAATEAEARKAYGDNYDKDWDGIGGITEMSHEEFKGWLDGDTTQPITDLPAAEVKAEPAEVAPTEPTEKEAAPEKPDEAKATSILDAANVVGKDRLDILSQYRKGDITIQDMEGAYPAEKKASTAAKKEIGMTYPVADRGEWYGDADYKARGGEMSNMSPDEYLGRVRKLTIDDESRENIDILKKHIESGKTLDPLAIYEDGTEDGRHRAHAAKELGIKKVPVILFGEQKTKQAEKRVEEPAKEIEDFGEKLGGARKDMPRTISQEITDDQIASMPLSKIWPKKSLDDIDDHFSAAFATAARELIPNKPRVSYKVDRWVKTVKTARELMSMIEDSSIDGKELLERIRGLRVYNNFVDKVELLNAIERNQWSRIGKVEVWADAYRFGENGEKILSPSAQVVIDGSRERIDGSKSIAEALPEIKEKLAGEEAPVTASKMKFEIRGRKGLYSINKTGDSEYRSLKSFTDLKEARAFIGDSHGELVEAWEAVKKRDNVTKRDIRSKENRPRSGEDYRKGENVTAEMFEDTFGFRGVEFGNWVKQGKNAKDRQGMLNQAYDALMDLSNIIGVPPKAISLNGELGLGFGSRGSGSASAHYEPGNIVINLTKTKGAGSLAHEWFHALDNYFQREKGVEMDHARESRYVTYNPEITYQYGDTKMTGRELARRRKQHPTAKYFNKDNWKKVEGSDNIRVEVAKAFADLVDSLNESPMKARASLIDKGAKDGYWSRIIERGARAFENYVISKMSHHGYINDYLANVKSVEDFARDPARYPYLLEDELVPVEESFDNLFGEIKTKETEKGVAMFSRKQQAEGKAVPAVVKSKDQSSAKKLNDAMANHFNEEWKNAYEQSELPDNVVSFGAEIERIFDTEVVAVTPTTEEFNIFNGFHFNNKLHINTKEEVGFVNIVGHELYHDIAKRRPDLHKWLVGHLRKDTKNISKYADKLDLARAYGEKRHSLTEVEEELLSDITGDAMADPEFLQKLADDNPTMFKKLIDAVQMWLGKLSKKMKGLGSERYVDDVDAMRSHLRRAINAYTKGEKIADAVTKPKFSVVDKTKPAVDTDIEVKEITDEEAQTAIEEYAASIRRRGLQGDQDLYRTVGGGSPRTGWLENSSIARNGNPIIVYRASRTDLTPEKFDQLGAATGVPASGLGVFTSISREDVLKHGDNIQEFHLDIRNPKILKLTDLSKLTRAGRFKTIETAKTYSKYLQKQGHDGIIIDGRPDGAPVHFIAFEPEQFILPPKEAMPKMSRKEQMDTAAFKAWFKDSKVVGNDGMPLVVYHGTSEAGLQNDQFMKSMLGKVTKSKSAKAGFFFADNREVAAGYSNFANEKPVADLVAQSQKAEREQKWDLANELMAKAEKLEQEYAPKEMVIDAFLSINNPIEFDADENRFLDIEDEIHDAISRAKLGEHDGVIIKNLIDNADWGSDRSADHYVVFEPTQIKSATENVGLFDPVDPRISFSRRMSEPTEGNLGMPEEGKKDLFVRMFQDSFNRIKKLQAEIVKQGGVVDADSDVYLAEERSSGKTTARLTELDRDHMKPLVALMSGKDITLEQLDEYLMNKHAQERNEYIASINADMPDGGSGITTNDAKAYLKGLDNAVDFQEAAEMVYAVNQKHLNDLVKGGHLTQEAVNEMRSRYKYYVPLKGKEGVEERIGGGGRGFSISGAGLKSAMGRGESNLAESPVAHTFAQAESAIVRTEKTRVGQALVNLVRANPDKNFWTISERTYHTFVDLYGEPFEGFDKRPEGLVEDVDYHRTEVEIGGEKKIAYRLDPNYKNREDVFSVMDQGKELLIKVHDKVVMEQLKKMNSSQLSAVVRGAGTVNRYLAMINTALNPEFVITNLERDFQTAMVNLSGEQSGKMAYKVMKAMPMATRGIWQSVFDKGQSSWRTEFEEMQAEGGTIGFFGLEDTETKVKKIQDRLEGATTMLGKTKKGIAAVRDVVLDANLSVENSARLAAYKVAKDQWISEGMSRKEAKMKAASLAKNLTVNFNRKGELAPVLNSAYLFYNASIQGSARIITALSNKRVQKIVGGIAATSFALAMYNAAAGGDDDDGIPHWDKISDHLKQTNLIVMHPDGSGNYSKIKLPYGYNVFFYTGTAMHDLMFNPRKGVAETGMSMATAAMNAFNPIQGADVLDTLTPTVLKPFEQDVRNINFMGASIRPEFPFDRYERPESQKAFKSTSPELKEMMRAINTATGGDATHAGLIDLSPETVKHYVSWLTGGAGMTATRTLGTATALIKGEEVEIKKVPFLRTLGGKPGAYFDTDRFYKAAEEIAAAKEQIKKDRGTSDYLGTRAKYGKISKLDGRMKATKRRVKNLRRRRDRAYAAGNSVSAKEYSEKIRQEMMKMSKAYDKAIAK